MGRSKADFKALRELCGLTHGDVASALGVRNLSVKRWENPNTEPGWYEPPQDAWDYLDEMRERMEARADSMTLQAIDARDRSGSSEVEVPYHRGRGEHNHDHDGPEPVGFANAAARLAWLHLESEGFDVRFRFPRNVGQSEN